MLEPGRNYSVANTNYRYGFNGKEKSDEINGSGVDYDYGARIFDARLGRFLSVDPISNKFPELTPYQFASNRPIQGIDLEGKEVLLVTGTLNGFGLIAGGNIGGGFAIGKEGFAVYSSETISGGVGLELGGTVNVTVYPKMHDLNDLNGYAPGFSIAGGEGLITGASVNSSAGKWGGTLSGGPGVGVHLSGDFGITIYLKVVKWDDIVSFFQNTTEESKELMKVFGINKDNIQKSVQIIKNFYATSVKTLTNKRINYLNESNNKNQETITEATDFLNDYKRSNILYKIGAYISMKTVKAEKTKAENDSKKNNQEINELKTSINKN